MMCKACPADVEKPVNKKWIEIALILGLRPSQGGTKPISIGREAFRQNRGRDPGEIARKADAEKSASRSE